MSDTPRTDRQVIVINLLSGFDLDGKIVVDAEFARALERELVKARAELKRHSASIPPALLIDAHR